MILNTNKIVDKLQKAIDEGKKEIELPIEELEHLEEAWTPKNKPFYLTEYYGEGGTIKIINKRDNKNG